MQCSIWDEENCRVGKEQKSGKGVSGMSEAEKTNLASLSSEKGGIRSGHGGQRAVRQSQASQMKDRSSLPVFKVWPPC